MIEAISQFLINIFGNSPVLATIIIAIVPLIELKGAIPFGVSTAFWGEYALTAFEAFCCSILGGIIITIILAFIFKPIYNALKDKKFFKSIINFFTTSIKKKTQEVADNTNNEIVKEDIANSQNSNAQVSVQTTTSRTSEQVVTTNDIQNSKKALYKKLLIVFGFVALPIPGTGVYTGTALAILLGLNPLVSIITVTLGNIVAGIIIMTICAVFPAFSTILFFIFIALILVFLIYKLITHRLNNKSK